MTEERKECDVVMKGGVASGVVYPVALAGLAETYRFRSLGGTSAGAIAAAGAAAAEYRRQGGGLDANDGFERLSDLPTRIGEGRDGVPTIVSWFTPNPRTASLWRVGMQLLSGGGAVKKGLRTIDAAVKEWPLGAFFALVAFGLYMIFVFAPAVSGIAGAGVLVRLAFACFVATSGLVSAILVLLAAIGWRTYRQVQRLPKNGYGLSTGYLGKRDDRGLTSFLATEFNAIAGLPMDEPLTFGHLESRALELKMMTTNISFSRPYELPFLQRIFYYDVAAFESYFPPEVMKHLNAKAGRTLYANRAGEAYTSAPHEPEKKDWIQLRQLPEPSDMPVVVAVRMSLSFPVLLSAVPLWAFDYREPLTGKYPSAKEPYEPFTIKKLWFSDGGLTSNFPIHFFDRAIPNRPTFAINLRENDELAATDGFSHTSNMSDDVLPIHTGIGSLPSFLWRLINTMQEWVDSTALSLPGNRERIVTVFHSQEEGGLNLDMDAATIKRLASRGRSATDSLRKTFDLTKHRWVRYRVAMPHWFETASVVGARGDSTAGDTHAIVEILASEDGRIDVPYPLREGEHVAAQAAHKALCAAAVSADDPENPFGTGPGKTKPKPATVVRFVPKL